MTGSEIRNGGGTDRTARKRLLALLVVLIVGFLAMGIGIVDHEEEFGPSLEVTTPTPSQVGTPSSARATSARSPHRTSVETSTAKRPPSARATPTDTPPDSPDGPTASTAGGRDGDVVTDRKDGNERGNGVDLRIRGNAVSMRVSNALPGTGGRETIVLANDGRSSGRLAVNLSVADAENGLLEPERAASDDAAAGELSTALLVRVSVDRPGGRTYLFGSSGQYVLLASLDDVGAVDAGSLAGDEATTVTFEWRLPRTAGNEVQSDAVVMTWNISLRADRGR